ncbi:MAG: SRPBCC family protein [Candidatus Binataceae bacterium]
MKIAGEQTLSAARERVWELFNDPQRLSRLIPGCEELKTLGPNEYEGTISVGIAAVKGVYTGKLKLEEIRPPEHYKMLVDGKGKQGFIRGFGTLHLVPLDSSSTLVKYAGDVQIGGPLIAVGQRVIDSAAKMMLGQFFAAADADLKAASKGAIARQGIAINFWRYLVRLIKSFFSGR